MKKILLSLAVAALSTTAFAGEVQEIITIDNFSGVKVNTYGSFDYTSPTTGISYNAQLTKSTEANGSCLQFRSNNSNSGLVITANPKGAVFKSLKVEAGTGNTATRTFDVYGKDAAYTAPTQLYATAVGDQGTKIGSAKIVDNATVTADAGTNYTFIGARSTSGACYISKIIITYDIAGDTKKNAELKFDGTSATVYMAEKTFPGLTLTKATTAAVNYESSNPEVATVDHTTGVVTLVAPGTTTIEAQASENDEYYEGIATYTLTVLSDDVIYTNACTTTDCGFTSIFATDTFNPWSIDATYGLKASAYANKKANASDAVMASPVLDLTGRKNCTLNFEHVLNQFILNGTMLATVDEALQYISVVAREEGATEWTKLSNPVLPQKYDWNPWAKSGDIDLSAFDGKKTQIGFRYISTDEIAGTWEIKNVEVKGTKDSGTGVVDTLIDENAPAVYYNLQGVRVDNPVKGLYIKVQGNKTTKVLVK